VKTKFSQARIFALRGFTIKAENGKFFVAPTGRNTWTGPYKSLHHATTAIARKLSREFTQRTRRLHELRELQP
jgi:hypothetical protein